ncbi:MAG: PhoH family protein [Christensenellales bacterium]|jgi:PhoH-like ATPase
MVKTYVLDTNVLVQAPHALTSFEDNTIILPLAVLEELDGLKNADGERGRNARQAIRMLEALRLTGDMARGIPLPAGGQLRLESNHAHITLPSGMNPSSADSRVLKVCKGLMDQGTQVVLVTKDIVVRIKAQMMGIPAEDFTTDQAEEDTLQYTGRAEAYMADSQMASFKRSGVKLKDVYQLGENHEKLPVEAVENQFFTLRSDLSERKTLLGRYNKGKITPLSSLNDRPFGVKARNVGQRFLQEALLLDPALAPLVLVKGAAGTAKTFYAMAAGLEMVLEQRLYRKILVCRPNAQFDEDIGFLPGNEQEKISPLMRPIIDNLEILFEREDENKKDRKGKETAESDLKSRIDYLFDTGVIVAEAMNFMRGRSIKNTYLVIDEAQNLSPRQVKGIITRVGEGTKVVLLGDPAQIDHPMLDARTNGLSYASDRMKGSPLCVQLTMLADECERSALALDAAKRM